MELVGNGVESTGQKGGGGVEGHSSMMPKDFWTLAFKEGLHPEDP